MIFNEMENPLDYSEFLRLGGNLPKHVYVLLAGKYLLAQYEGKTVEELNAELAAEIALEMGGGKPALPLNQTKAAAPCGSCGGGRVR